jgi:hypothetical protein
MNWLHGHWEEHAGATWYDGEQNGKLRHTISAKTDWVVACGRNVETRGSDGTIINGVTTAWAPGGRGNCELGINCGHAEYSHWQLCKLYVWDHHLPDDIFAQVSKRLMNYLAGASKEAGDRDATNAPDKVRISIKIGRK